MPPSHYVRRSKQARYTPRWITKRLWREWDGTCGICGQRVEEDEDKHIDHIRPICRGGESNPSNLRIVHSQCNLARCR